MTRREVRQWQAREKRPFALAAIALLAIMALASGCALSITGPATASMPTGLNFKGTQQQAASGDPLTSAGGAAFTSNSLSAQPPVSAFAGVTPGGGLPNTADDTARVKVRTLQPSVPMPPPSAP